MAVAWFLFTWCVLYMTAPLLRRVQGMYATAFKIGAALLLVILAVCHNRLAVLSWRFPQCLWFHLYLTYFIAGMSFSGMKIKGRAGKAICAVVTAVSFSVYFFNSALSSHRSAPDGYYGSVFYSLYLVGLFLLLKDVSFDILNTHSTCIQNTLITSLQNITARISQNTFCVYMAHLPILLSITVKHPVSSGKGAVMLIALLFVLCNIVAEIFRRIPLLRKVL